MRYADKWKPTKVFSDASGTSAESDRRRAREMSSLLGTGAQMAPGIGSALGGLAGGALGTFAAPGLGTAAGAGLGMGIGGALGSVVGAGMQHGANEQTRPYDEAEMKKIARQEAVQRLLGRYLP